MRGGNENESKLLAGAYHHSLELAAKHDVKSVAFPSISTGVYHFPLDQAAVIALSTIREFCQTKSSLEDIRFVVFTDRTYDAFSKALSETVHKD